METIKNDLFKFIGLGLPAVAILVAWRSSGVRNRTMYVLSWASPLGYLVWLVAIIVFRWITPQQLGGWLTVTATGLFIAAPLFGVLFSVTLLLGSIFAIAGQRWKMVISNTCMLLLWLASGIAAV